MESKRTFYHGHSYTANQLACAAALGSLKIFRDDKVIAGLEKKVACVAEALRSIASLEHVGDARQRGLIVGIELMQDAKSKTPYPWGETMGARVCLKAREYGLFIRPVGDVVVFMPPLVSTETELLDMLALLRKAVVAVTEEGAVVSGGGGAHF